MLRVESGQFAATAPAFNLPHLHLTPPLGVTPFEFCKAFQRQKPRVPGYHVTRFLEPFLALLTAAVSRCMPSVFTANLCGGFCTMYDLYVTLQQFDVDIACLTETWLNSAILPNLTDVTGYITMIH